MNAPSSGPSLPPLPMKVLAAASHATADAILHAHVED